MDAYATLFPATSIVAFIMFEMREDPCRRETPGVFFYANCSVSIAYNFIEKVVDFLRLFAILSTSSRYEYIST